MQTGTLKAQVSDKFNVSYSISFLLKFTNNTTGDVVFVASQNEEILYHAIDSINFTAGNNTNITKNTTDAKTTESTTQSKNTSTKSTDEKKKIDEGAYAEGYIAENDQDFDYDGDGVGDGSAYHSHEYYVERGQTKPVSVGGG